MYRFAGGWRGIHRLADGDLEIQRPSGGIRVDIAGVEAPQNIRDLVEIGTVQLAEVRAKEFAFTCHDHRERHRVELEPRLLGHGHGIHLANQDRVVEPGRFCILLHFVHDVHGDADDQDAVIALFGLKLLERRHGAHQVAQKLSSRWRPSNSSKSRISPSSPASENEGCELTSSVVSVAGTYSFTDGAMRADMNNAPAMRPSSATPNIRRTFDTLITLYSVLAVTVDAENALPTCSANAFAFM